MGGVGVGSRENQLCWSGESRGRASTSAGHLGLLFLLLVASRLFLGFYLASSEKGVCSSVLESLC